MDTEGYIKFIVHEPAFEEEAEIKVEMQLDSSATVCCVVSNFRDFLRRAGYGEGIIDQAFKNVV